MRWLSILTFESTEDILQYYPSILFSFLVLLFVLIIRPGQLSNWVIFSKTVCKYVVRNSWNNKEELCTICWLVISGEIDGVKAICVSDGGGEECSQKEANINWQEVKVNIRNSKLLTWHRHLTTVKRREEEPRKISRFLYVGLDYIFINILTKSLALIWEIYITLYNKCIM